MKMRKGTILAVAMAAFVAGLGAPPQAAAAVSSHTMAEFTAYPITVSQTATPLVMLVMSNDHQYYFKAYNDYSDLDADGVVEATYTHAIDYYGYFDPYKCYQYDSADGRFEPVAETADKYCPAGSGQWSGNFLNWATMTRMDAVRRVLFGGLRYIDTDGETVLERAFLPHDAHSFAKFYNGSDLGKLTPWSYSEGVTLCNTTAAASSSSTSEAMDHTDPPLVRVARGDFSLWASNERFQCRWREEMSSVGQGKNKNNPAVSGIPAASDSPKESGDNNGDGFDDKLGEYVARVQACVPGLVGTEPCKTYPNGNLKPVGLLQTYGEGGKMWFGLFAGTYEKNKSGGDLVADIGRIDDPTDGEIDPDTGRFRWVSQRVQLGGVPDNKVKGIINALSRYRIVNYRYGDGTYGTGGLNSTKCTWGISSFSNGQCQNWGNPFGEIYLQAIRYLAGEAKANLFEANDHTLLKGLQGPQAWKCPLGTGNSCARLSVVAINGSTISYDGDELDSASAGVDKLDPADSVDSASLTDIVGDGEGIHGSAWFVGEAGSDRNQLCTEKTVSSLGDVEGICPEAPRLDGTYRVAGLAWYAHTHDLRPDSDPARALDGEQRVDTYALSLATAVPKIEIRVPGDPSRVVRILPACRNESLSPPGNCAIVDFRIVSQDPDYIDPADGHRKARGKLYVNWEDSEQGGDYDQDMWGIIEYVLDADAGTAGQLTVTTDAIAESTIYEMGFGYVLSGTTQDGFHAHSGIEGYSYTDPTGVAGCSNCQVGDGPTSVTYDLSPAGSGAALLEDPLWYAAKWGGFQDRNGNDIPDLVAEWDQVDNLTGIKTPDGVPDNYFFAANPGQIEEMLGRVFANILKRASSGTAAAVVSSSATGAGALYQAFFVPERSDSAGNTVRWIGNLHALWVDEAGRLREDDGDGVLEDYQTDRVIELFYDDVDRRTKVRRFDSGDPDRFDPPLDASGNPVPAEVAELDEIQPIWSARERLSELKNVAGTQRAYGTVSTTGRYVKTWIDADLDGVVDSGEYKDFVTANIDSSNYGFFDVADEATAKAVVRWVRGGEPTGMRNRDVDYDGDGTVERIRLGDIVNSTPTVVAAPAENFDLLYGDSSYATFRMLYAHRRHVVYVGANDGMLHAFNAGFYDEKTKSFKLQPSGCTSCPAAHPLGTELWAYVPGNLLPHLKWLTDPDYTHVYYVDATPYAFDAKIFADDATHPGGWGTVLVVGMRLGGGPMTIDTDGDGTYESTFSSAYAIFDVTDPEQEPELLAEVRLPDQSFTTSRPSAAAFVDSTTNGWYLLLGSGPDDLTTASASGKAKIYVLDLKDLAAGVVRTIDTGVPGTFVGDFATVDWDLDQLDDTVVVGLIGDADADTGGLYRIELGETDDPASWTHGLLIDTAAPVSTAAVPAIDLDLNRWILFGTGRLLVEADKSSTATQALYGLRLPASAATSVTTSELLDVTGVDVFTDGSTDHATYTTFSDLYDAINGSSASFKGWKRELEASTGGEPSERVVSDPRLFGKVFFASAYTPNNNLCEAEGTSRLYGLYFLTGTARPELEVFGTAATGTGKLEVLERIDLGWGVASSPALHVGSGKSGGEITVYTQTSTGTIQVEDAEVSSSVRSGEINWREYRE
ncbi:pilus assembly protein [Inmirania thermothiophila]|uniref:Type IV pilus assembly protein PilY1 n=1 Tax=Inmirania thermothiophila TaxID=1750597 RepID=A0A3N1Y846_9GAMM|nr:PilC/PilY family type IV pilus protein [Inmirania thermothiophila]ROR34993.1 type IV pilus assembly protein PilY1 [Inmirania thermothiophila]